MEEEKPCTGCGEPIRLDARIAGMAWRYSGDTYWQNWYRCEECGAYSSLFCREPFLRDEIIERWYGPYSDDRVEARLALIARCDTPFDANCECQAHDEYADLP